MVAAMDSVVVAAAVAAAGGGVQEQLHQVTVAEGTHSPEKGCYSSHCYCESEHPGTKRRQSCWGCHCFQGLRYSVITVGMDIFTSVGSIRLQMLCNISIHIKGCGQIVFQLATLAVLS